MSEKIIITEADLPPAPTPVYDQVLGVYKGEPWTSDAAGNYLFAVPDDPHVMQTFVESADSGGIFSRSPEPVTTLVAHGFRDTDGGWSFKDGRPVRPFIDQYNRANPSQPIAVAAVCNPTNEVHATTQHVVGSEAGVSGYKDGLDTVVTVSVLRPETGALYIPQ